MTKRKPPKVSVEDWNRLHPIGTPVRYHSITTLEEFTVHKTRSQAWLMGGHTPVVQLADKSGCVSLESLDVCQCPHCYDTGTDHREQTEMGLTGCACECPAGEALMEAHYAAHPEDR